MTCTRFFASALAMISLFNQAGFTGPLEDQGNRHASTCFPWNTQTLASRPATIPLEKRLTAPLRIIIATASNLTAVAGSEQSIRELTRGLFEVRPGSEIHWVYRGYAEPLTDSR